MSLPNNAEVSSDPKAEFTRGVRLGEASKAGKFDRTLSDTAYLFIIIWFQTPTTSISFILSHQGSFHTDHQIWRQRTVEACLYSNQFSHCLLANSFTVSCLAIGLRERCPERSRIYQGIWAGTCSELSSSALDSLLDTVANVSVPFICLLDSERNKISCSSSYLSLMRLRAHKNNPKLQGLEKKT